MREHLLGYLLGALDESEHECVEKALQCDPLLQEQLSILSMRIAPLEKLADDHDPPVGLAKRTCAKISEAVSSVESESLPVAGRLQPIGGAELTRGRWSAADWIVAAGVVAATAILFLPVIANSREIARRNICQDKQRQLGMSLTQHSDTDPEHRFPAVPSMGNDSFAGIVAVTLNEDGLLTDPSILICPGSRLADDVTGFQIPSRQEIMAARGPRLTMLREIAGGSLGYNLGVVVNNQHRPVRNQSRSYFAVAADSPSGNSANGQSMNHGGRGQNVLYEDGHVNYVVCFPEGPNIDHPFRNRNGQVEAGVDDEDAVIGSSQTAPFIRLLSLPVR